MKSVWIIKTGSSIFGIFTTKPKALKWFKKTVTLPYKVAWISDSFAIIVHPDAKTDDIKTTLGMRTINMAMQLQHYKVEG
jgi:hypothetical protein